MEKIRIGVFGLNRGYDYFDSIVKNGFEIVAVCDKLPHWRERAKEWLKDDSVGVYERFDDFIEHEMDAVFLANYFHEHVPYAVRCLEKDLHVLSECLPNGTMAEGVALVRAAEKSKGIYMMAENYPYMKFNQEIRRVCDTGTLGRIMFAEGEYNHPVGAHDTWFINHYKKEEYHWRHFLPATYYVTHSLAPLMYATGAFPTRVTAFPIYMPLSDDYSTNCHVGDTTAIITTHNDDGSVFRVTGCANFGAHGNSYRVCGEKGQIENLRGMDGKIMLRYNDWDIPEGLQETNLYEPEWPEAAEEVGAAGHGGGDYFVMRRFRQVIQGEHENDFDVYFSTCTASVAILAHRSLMAGGAPFDIPDFRLESDRRKYENDVATPFWGEDGSAPNIPCCSNPAYKPTAEQVRKFREVTSSDQC